MLFLTWKLMVLRGHALGKYAQKNRQGDKQKMAISSEQHFNSSIPIRSKILIH
jgi:hypothetical protein